MDREAAKAELLTREPDFLQRAKKRGYICPNPVCGNGSGKDGTGITLDPHDNRHYKCYVCGLYEDVIGLWKYHKGITDDNEAFTTLYEHYGIHIDGQSQGNYKQVYQKQDKSEQNTPQASIHTNTYTQQEEKKNPPARYELYLKQCHERVGQTDYFKNSRGFSDETINKYKLGYDPHFINGTGGKVWQAAIIPTSSDFASFIARNLDPNAPKGERYRKVGESKVYLAKTLQNATSPIIVTEGEFDALSIVEVGGEAIGLGSTGNAKKLIELLQGQKPVQPLILALDNDSAGEEAIEGLEEALKELHIPYSRRNPYGEAKDANEALIASRETLTAKVEEIINNAGNIEEEFKAKEEAAFNAQKEEYLKTSTAHYIQDFIDGIADSANTPYIPTGFTKLDEILDGGLYEGLYFMGAISSLGKTTLALQIADQIAQGGEDVLIFSLEMARSELMAKSISRLTLLDVLQNKGRVGDAKTTRGITTGSRYLKYSQTEKELITRATLAYSEYAPNIYIHEGIGEIGIQQIRETVEKHILFTGKKPVIVIDYVQILAPADMRATDKQNTDKAVLGLKRISRDFKIPVIGISSFNRAKYNEAVTMEAYKESGSIEYSSDVLIGLQLKGAGGKDFDTNEAKAKNPREVDLVILKNRNGATGKTISFEYYPLFNYFKES